MRVSLSTIRKYSIPALRCYLQAAGEKDDPVGFCYNHIISPAQVRFEFEALAKLISVLRPKVAMEIGTYFGATLFILCKLSDPSATIISLDLPGGRFGGGYHWVLIPLFKRFALPGQTLHLVRGDSHSAKTRSGIHSTLGSRKLDYLLIDADHTYEGVKRDFEMYSPLVRKGGIVAFHDIVRHKTALDCQVDRFWNEIKQRYSSQEIVEDREQGWAGIGVLEMI